MLGKVSRFRHEPNITLDLSQFEAVTAAQAQPLQYLFRDNNALGIADLADCALHHFIPCNNGVTTWSDPAATSYSAGCLMLFSRTIQKQCPAIAVTRMPPPTSVIVAGVSAKISQTQIGASTVSSR